jgi:hypothetical protein
MMATLSNGRSGHVLMWIELLADGTFKGTWHDLSPGLSATGTKGK